MAQMTASKPVSSRPTTRKPVATSSSYDFLLGAGRDGYFTRQGVVRVK